MFCVKTGLPDHERVWVIVMINLMRCVQSGIFILGDSSPNVLISYDPEKMLLVSIYSIRRGGKFSRHMSRPIAGKGPAARIQWLQCQRLQFLKGYSVLYRFQGRGLYRSRTRHNASRIYCWCSRISLLRHTKTQL